MSNKMSNIRNLWKWLSSMRFAIILLVTLAASCALASTIPQGQTYNWYASNYSARMAALIVAFHFDDAFHSWWFILINVFLCVNLLCCNLIRFPGLCRKTRVYGRTVSPDTRPDVEETGVQNPEAVFHALGVNQFRRDTADDGREILYGVKNRAGIWGAWVCHLGILLLIAGFSLGQATKQEYTVYGVPGQTRAIGDTGFSLTIDDFRVGLREDDTVEQYTADITVTPSLTDNDTGKNTSAQSASISVNAPAKLFGMSFFQNSTGWAARIRVEEDAQFLQEDILCAGEYLRVSDKPDLVIYFNAFYPDYELIPGEGPRTRSGQLNNPAYLYSVYYLGQMIGMNVLTGDEQLTIDEYTVTFSDPQSYTLIQVKKDSFTGLALLGGIAAMTGLFLAFYIQPEKIWAVRENDGWTICGTCAKGGILFREKFTCTVKNVRAKGDRQNAGN